MKGVSAFIATALIVGITVTVAAVVVPWLVSFAQMQITTVTTSGEKKVNCIESGLYFSGSDVGYNSLTNPNRVNVTVKNSGLVDLHTFKVQLKVSGAWTKLYGTSKLYNASYPLEPQERTTLNASIDESLTGVLQSVRVVAQSCDIAYEVNI